MCVYYSQHYVIINKVVSLTPPDPSLTPANLLHVTRRIPLWRSEDSYECLSMPESQHEEIVRMLGGEEAKQQLFTTWLASHPCPSWEDVKSLLKHGVGGEEGERVADEVEDTYIKSELGKWSKYTYSFSFNKYNTFLSVTVNTVA